MISKLMYSVFVAVLFLSTSTVSAHGTGIGFEESVEGGFIDVGSSVLEFTDDTSVVFDFNLFTEKDGDDVPYTDVWVRFVRDNATVFASGIYNARLGGPLMTYVFPVAGEYEMILRFQNNGQSLAEATFPIQVSKGQREGNETKLVWGAAALLGVLVMVIGFILFYKVKYA